MNQSIISCIYKFQVKKAPDYMDEILLHAECNRIATCYSYQKVKLPRRKTIQGLIALSYIGSKLWNDQDNSLKSFVSLKTLKHNVRVYYFWKINKKIVICYFNLFALFVIFSFLKRTTMKLMLLQLSLYHPSHNFIFIYFLVFLV